MENKSRALAAGIFVLALLGLLLWLASWLMRDTHQYREYEISTSSAVSGLQVQGAVRYKGVQVGKVTRVELDPQESGHVLIRIAVDAATPVGPATFARLGYQGVTGLAHVQLDTDPALAAAAPLPPGPGGLPRLPLRASPFAQLADHGQALLARADAVSRRLLDLMGPDKQERVAQLLDNLTVAAGSASQLAQAAEQTLARSEKQARLPELTRQAQQTLHAMEQAAGKVSSMAQAWRESAQRANAADGALTQLTQASRALTQLAEALGRDTVPQARQALEDVARAAQSLSAAADALADNPQALIYGPGAGQPGPGEPGFVAPPMPAVPPVPAR